MLAALACLMALAVAAPAAAQTAPSREDLAIYAGLHEAAAKGDVAGIERLIKEGEKPDLQDSIRPAGRGARRSRPARPKPGSGPRSCNATSGRGGADSSDRPARRAASF
jgi:hypothetical protein